MAVAPKFREAHRPLTVADYMDMPDDGNQYELIHGELVMSPSAFFAHGLVVAHVVGKLQTFVQPRKLGHVVVEIDVVMGKDLVLRPDISFVSKRRLSIIRGHIYGPPDLAIEVTSPSNWQMDVFAKRLEYERFGVREFWVLDIVQDEYKTYQWVLRGEQYVGGLVHVPEISSRVLKGFKLNLEAAWDAAGH